MVSWFSYAFVTTVVLGPMAYGAVRKQASYISSLRTIIAQSRRTRMELKAGSPQSLPRIDMARIADLTAQLESLGFERVADHVTRILYDYGVPASSLAPAAPIAAPRAPQMPQRFIPRGFGRLMLHRQNHLLRDN